MTEFLDTGMRHHAHSLKDLEQTPDIPPALMAASQVLSRRSEEQSVDQASGLRPQQWTPAHLQHWLHINYRTAWRNWRRALQKQICWKLSTPSGALKLMTCPVKRPIVRNTFHCWRPGLPKAGRNWPPCRPLQTIGLRR